MADVAPGARRWQLIRSHGNHDFAAMLQNVKMCHNKTIGRARKRFEKGKPETLLKAIQNAPCEPYVKDGTVVVPGSLYILDSPRAVESAPKIQAYWNTHHCFQEIVADALRDNASNAMHSNDDAAMAQLHTELVLYQERHFTKIRGELLPSLVFLLRG